MASSNPDRFQRAIAELQEKLDECNIKVNRKDNGFSSLVVIGAIMPVLVFMILYLIQPRFVTTEQDGKKIRSKKKIFFWTVGATLLVWAGLYLYACLNSYTRTPFSSV